MTRPARPAADCRNIHYIAIQTVSMVSPDPAGSKGPNICGSLWGCLSVFITRTLNSTHLITRTRRHRRLQPSDPVFLCPALNINWTRGFAKNLSLGIHGLTEEEDQQCWWAGMTVGFCNYPVAVCERKILLFDLPYKAGRGSV